MTTILNEILSAIAPKAFAIAGKEISKKAIIGGAAGVAVLAGGTTAAVIHHKKKKAAENEAPIEEAGAEKIDSEQKPAEASTKEDEKTVAEDKAEESHPQQTTEQPETKDEMEQKTVNGVTEPAQEITNPNPNIPNPAFAFAQQMGINLGMPPQNFAPFYANPMSGPLVGAPMPPIPESEAPVPNETVAEQKEEEEVVEEKIEETAGDDKITAADIASGNVEKKVISKKKK